jgi:hypothetical protein
MHRVNFRERGDEQAIRRQCFCWACGRKRSTRNPSMGSTRQRSRDAKEAMEVRALQEDGRGKTFWPHAYKRDFERTVGGGKGKKRKRYPALIIRTTRRHPNNLDKSRISLGMTTGLHPKL